MSKIIFTTYYTGKPNPQKTAKEAVPNDFSMIEEWYNSVVRLGLKGYIFHDHLTEAFTEKYSCDNVLFIKVPYYSNRGLNDERYYVYLEELSDPNIEWVLTTDLFDVEFYKDPFEFMTDKDKLYVGTETEDVSNIPSIKLRAKWSYGEDIDWWSKNIKNMINAGIIGGHRDIVIDLFKRMIKDFEGVDPKLNVNMTVAAKCILADKVPFVTGQPFHTMYKKNDRSGECYIRHK